MNYKVLARRYRPARFSDVVGQEHVVRTLVNAIKADRIAHAYLFAGSRGVGKTSTARIFAKALNCPNKTDYEPCCECDVCLAIAEGEDMDVIEMDAASNRGIDDIRNLRENVSFRPARSPWKIYIIDEVHMLTREAFNALLKTLEEPPDYVKFVFCTTEPERIPPTILSRCQRFDFHRLPLSDITGKLRQIAREEGFEVDDDALSAIARYARGGLRDSISLLEQLLSFASGRITVEDVKVVIGAVSPERLKELVLACAQGNAGEAVRTLGALLDSGRDSLELLDQLTAFLRDCLLAREAPQAGDLLQGWITPEDISGSPLGKLSVTALLLMLNYLYWARPFLKEDSSGRVPLEIAVVRMAHASEILDIPFVLRALGRSGRALLEAERKGDLPSLDVRTPSPANGPRTASSSPSASPEPPPAADVSTGRRPASGLAAVEELWYSFLEEPEPSAVPELKKTKLRLGDEGWVFEIRQPLGEKANTLMDEFRLRAEKKLGIKVRMPAWRAKTGEVLDTDELKKDSVVGKVMKLFPGALIEDARRKNPSDPT